MVAVQEFEIIIGRAEHGIYPLLATYIMLAEDDSPDLDTLSFPFGILHLELAQVELQARLHAADVRLINGMLPDAALGRGFGEALFEAVFSRQLRDSYDRARYAAEQRGLRLRLRLAVEAPELATLPWELLFDPRRGRGEFVCLANTPLVRALPVPTLMQNFAVTQPLRLLGLVACPCDLPQLDVAREQQVIEEALAPAQADGRVELHWLKGSGWRDLQQVLRREGPWHVLHFIGHGGFDAEAGEGYLALTDDDGLTYRLLATQLARICDDHKPLRLVVLNACEGARSSEADAFSSTAAGLLCGGAPAVLAMQYVMSDGAACSFARCFYESLADLVPLDRAVGEARESLSMEQGMNWVAPVLYLQGINGQLFASARSCAACGTPARPQSRFCTSCGHALA